MHLSRALATIALTALAAFSDAHSTIRNPLKQINIAKNPSILTQNHRVTALSNFDVAFDVAGTRMRLSLEPNHDIFPEDAKVTYLGADGTVTREEPIDRLAHKVFHGTAWIKRGDRWDNVGWARIYIHQDGVEPLFEGAFTVHHDHHHIQLSSNYKTSRQEQDPDLSLRHEDFMVVLRDSDISTQPEHTELRKRSGDISCRADELEANQQLDHPVFASMSIKPRDDGFFAPIKRQNLDNTPGSGNGAGVNLVSSIGSTQGCPTTRKVALVGIAADCTYTRELNGTDRTRANIIAQMNTASTLFENTFNISLGLANLVITDAQCPTSVQQATPWNQPCSPQVDIQQRLNLFSQWRGQQRDSNSHWTLLTTCNTDSAVGLAWLGQACMTGSSPNGQGGETVAGANVVVRTSQEWQVIAHETGHTFGAVHDCTSRTCRDSTTVSSQQCCPLSSSTCDAGEQFIMNPSTAQGIQRFSPCSIGNICSAFGRGGVKSNCLTNNRGVTTISGQTCGNGIVEGDEQCDCGGPTGCGNNQCCDPRTCRFRNNAVCDDSNEDCCKNCQLASSSYVCRPSSGACDPEEKCSGTSPYCPADQTRDDGSSCGSGLQCASGQCTSRDLQCKTVMGSYTQGNDTYACDDRNCMISCASPQFERGSCVGLQQNFLDGTPCTGGGKCLNGRCDGGSVANEVGGWFRDHKELVIGIASGVGGLIVLCILICCWRSYKRRKTGKKYAASAAAASVAYRGGSQGPRPHGGPGNAGTSRSRSRISRRHMSPPPQQANMEQNGNAGGGGFGNMGWDRGNGGQGQGQQQQQQFGPVSPVGGSNVPSPPPIYQRSNSVRYA
ncbi:ADAM 8 precursor [Dendryphion nanum]|uniref:Disintegrin and metalloproteinase domain-containing protein B n=1 Tax=Dendryphion nanum TaxID=256645 RepID=A0A9P9DDD2_9PLEO|nr:ADAM 8 precursor [Dendryphion nanum]